MANLFDLSVRNQKGEMEELSQFKNKVVLVVNTATGCGFTPQYEGLEKLYKDHKDEGFVILDFPCNQFLGQAPGTDQEIHEFCTLKYNVSFPQFSKIKVNGINADPVFKFLKSEIKGSVKWNFEKFLVNKEGHLIKRYPTTVKPEDIEADIIEELKK